MYRSARLPLRPIARINIIGFTQFGQRQGAMWLPSGWFCQCNILDAGSVQMKLATGSIKGSGLTDGGGTSSRSRRRSDSLQWRICGNCGKTMPVFGKLFPFSFHGTFSRSKPRQSSPATDTFPPRQQRSAMSPSGGKDGVIGPAFLLIAEDWVLRFRLMVKRGPR